MDRTTKRRKTQKPQSTAARQYGVNDAEAANKSERPARHIMSGGNYGNVDWEYRRRHYGEDVGKHVAGTPEDPKREPKRHGSEARKKQS